MSNYNYNRAILSNRFSGTVIVDVAEFSYSNAKLTEEYSIETNALTPDVFQGTDYSEPFQFVSILIVIMLLYSIVKGLLKVN